MVTETLVGSPPLLTHAHTLERAVADALDEVAGVGLDLATPDTKAHALRSLARTAARLEALRMRVAAAATDVAATDGHRDLGTWLAHHTRTDRTHTTRHTQLATALDTRWHATATALAAGDLSLDQARVIAHALTALTPDGPANRGPTGHQPHLDPDVLVRAEAYLLDQAAHYGPRELKILGRHLLTVIAPEIGEDTERRRLEAEERHARQRTSLRSWRLGDGRTKIVAILPDSLADRLLTYLAAYTSPRHSTPAETNAETRTPYEYRQGQAFCSLLESLDPHRLPIHGGDATTIVVTIPLEALRTGLGTATLAGTPDSTEITAGEARRLACHAGILPAVLGGKSEVLDLGRRSRLFTPAQRTALQLHHPHCQAEGCRIPARWCEAHHDTPWAHGGPTDLAHAQLLCPYHHHRTHDPTYTTTTLPTGDLRFHRRT